MRLAARKAEVALSPATPPRTVLAHRMEASEEPSTDVTHVAAPLVVARPSFRVENYLHAAVSIDVLPTSRSTCSGPCSCRGRLPAAHAQPSCVGARVAGCRRDYAAAGGSDWGVMLSSIRPLQALSHAACRNTQGAVVRALPQDMAAACGSIPAVNLCERATSADREFMLVWL